MPGCLSWTFPPEASAHGRRGRGGGNGVQRPKSGFGAPLRRWMRHELRPLLVDLLSVESLKRRELFDPVAVQRLIARNDRGEVDASYTLLSLLCIEVWCRKYLDAAAGTVKMAH